MLVRRRVAISLVVFGCLIAHDLAHYEFPRFNMGMRRDWQAFLGAFLVLAGVGIRCSWSAGSIDKSRVLATTGPYSLCRNPLYLGSFMMMIGFCAIIGCLYNFAFVCGPNAMLYAVAVASEENRLRAKHWEHWPTYAASTWRFLPRIGAYVPSDWSWRQWIKNREYFTLLLTPSSLVLLEMLSHRRSSAFTQ